MAVTYKDIAMALPKSVKMRATSEAKSHLGDGESLTYSLILAYVTDEEYAEALEAAESGTVVEEVSDEKTSKRDVPVKTNDKKRSEDDFDVELTSDEEKVLGKSIPAQFQALETPKKIGIIAAIVALIVALIFAIISITGANRQKELQISDLEGSYALSKVVFDGATVDFSKWTNAGRSDDKSTAFKSFIMAPMTVTGGSLSIVWLPFETLGESIGSFDLPNSFSSLLNTISKSHFTTSNDGQNWLSDDVGNRVPIIFNENEFALELTSFMTDYNDSAYVVFSRIDEMEHQTRLTTFNALSGDQRSQVASQLIKLLIETSRLGNPLGSLKLNVTTTGANGVGKVNNTDVSVGANDSQIVIDTGNESTTNESTADVGTTDTAGTETNDSKSDQSQNNNESINTVETLAEESNSDLEALDEAA